MRLIGLAMIVAIAASPALAQPSATTVGSKVSQGGNTVGGTAGSAAAGGTSASTIGLGASATSGATRSSAIGSGGSAAAVNGRATTRTKVHANPQILQGHSRARAQDGGTWSRSMSRTMVRRDGDVRSWTRSMAHQPGGKPAMSRTRVR